MTVESTAAVFRGGMDLTPTPADVKIDRGTGLLLPTHGVSLSSDPMLVERFGGAFQVESIVEGLVIRQRGKRLTHYELMPAQPMTMDRYQELLQRVVLKRFSGSRG